MHIGEVLNTIYDGFVGWRPVSGGIKPVHVANGLFRALCGVYGDPTRLHEFVVSWEKKGKKLNDERTFEALIAADTDGVYEAFRGRPPQLFEQARTYTLGLVGGDRAIFPKLDMSSFSLTCRQMVTHDHNDRYVGDFIAQTLLNDGPLAELVRSHLAVTKPKDPITALAWPLLGGGDRPFTSRTRKAKQNRIQAEYLVQMREAAACLESHELRHGNRLRTLQRVVQFGVVAIHAHAQALAAGGRLDDRSPLLVAMGEGRQSDIAVASERSLDLNTRAFELWLGDRLADRIRAGDPLVNEGDPMPNDTTNIKSIKAALTKIGVAKKPHGTPGAEVIDGRVGTFKRLCEEYEGDPSSALGHTLVDCYLRENESGGPGEFLTGLGRLIGLLFPPKQGRPRNKRVRPSVLVLDMLVRACVRAGEAVPLDLFLQRLWDRFGLIVGGRRGDEWDDVKVLAERGLALESEDLVANTELFVDELAAMGLARRYPDHVAFVGDGSL